MADPQTTIPPPTPTPIAGRPPVPTECPLLVTFYRDERLLRPVTFQDVRYLLVGDDYGTLLALRADTDELWSIGGDLARPRFVDSHLWDFVLLLGRYDAQEGPEFARHVSATDPTVLADANSWWSLIVEQLEDDLAP